MINCALVRPYFSVIMAVLAMHILYFVTNVTNGFILNLNLAHLFFMCLTGVRTVLVLLNQDYLSLLMSSLGLS
jgi:hypothetical protein